MKLTHVSMDVSFIGSHLSTDDVRVKQLAGFFTQCTTLQALELRTDIDSFNLLILLLSITNCCPTFCHLNIVG